MTVDDAILAGTQFARDYLRIVEAAYGQKVAMAYAGGMAAGVRNVVARQQSGMAAYSLMQGLADDIVGQVQCR